MPKTWIEAALNGPWSRKRQPGIPDTVDAIVADGVACAAAGANVFVAGTYLYRAPDFPQALRALRAAACPEQAASPR